MNRSSATSAPCNLRTLSALARVIISESLVAIVAVVAVIAKAILAVRITLYAGVVVSLGVAGIAGLAVPTRIFVATSAEGGVVATVIYRVVVVTSSVPLVAILASPTAILAQYRVATVCGVSVVT